MLLLIGKPKLALEAACDTISCHQFIRDSDPDTLADICCLANAIARVIGNAELAQVFMDIASLCSPVSSDNTQCPKSTAAKMILNYAIRYDCPDLVNQALVDLTEIAEKSSSRINFEDIVLNFFDQHSDIFYYLDEHQIDSLFIQSQSKSRFYAIKAIHFFDIENPDLSVLESCFYFTSDELTNMDTNSRIKAIDANISTMQAYEIYQQKEKVKAASRATTEILKNPFNDSELSCHTASFYVQLIRAQTTIIETLGEAMEHISLFAKLLQDTPDYQQAKELENFLICISEL